jgi:hypothetical protein
MMQCMSGSGVARYAATRHGRISDYKFIRDYGTVAVVM